jgi:hypothetical protein
MRIRGLFLAVVCVMFFVTSALAVEVQDERAPAIGAVFAYTTVPDGFLDNVYEKHTSIAAYAYGVWVSYGLNQFDLQWSLKNYALLIGDGEWRVDGDDPIDTSHVETDLGMIGVDMSVFWKWRVHPVVEPYVGPTLGMGFIYGSLDVDDSDKLGNPLGDSQEKEMPPVVPIVGFQGGVRFYPHPNVRLSVDLGVVNGFFGGVSAGYAF